MCLGPTGGRHAADIGGEKEKGARAEGDVRRGVCRLVGGDGEEAVLGQVHPLSAQWGTCVQARAGRAWAGSLLGSEAQEGIGI